MIRISQRARRYIAATLLASATLSGCASSNPERTHEGKLLDNKVTAERVHAALRKAGPQFRDVGVHASKKGITLTGTVASAEARSRAEEIAKDVDPRVELSDRVSVR